MSLACVPVVLLRPNHKSFGSAEDFFKSPCRVQGRALQRKRLMSECVNRKLLYSGLGVAQHLSVNRHLPTESGSAFCSQACCPKRLSFVLKARNRFGRSPIAEHTCVPVVLLEPFPLAALFHCPYILYHHLRWGSEVVAPGRFCFSLASLYILYHK